MDSLRKPFQGVWNIIRFNWQYYALSLFLILLLFLIRNNINPFFKAAAITGMVIIICSTLISLIVSTYIYDFSILYSFSWLKFLKQDQNQTIININAGFDETSKSLEKRFENERLFVADFYDPGKHTEVSIRRARKAYPPFPNTQKINTKHLPFDPNSAHKIFTILSAHEIRDPDERVSFFKEMKRVLKPNGQIIVTEHLRDTINFLAYNFGFLHFYSRTTWIKTFHLSGLQIVSEIKITPFLTTFILEKNGTAS